MRPSKAAALRAIRGEAEQDDEFDLQELLSDDDEIGLQEGSIDFDDDEDAGPEDDELEEGNLTDLEHASESEDEEQIQDYGLVSPSNSTWQPLTQGSQHGAGGRQAQHNIFRGEPFAIARGINPSTPCEAFLMFTDFMIDEMVIYTNLQARRQVRDYNRINNTQKVWKVTDRTEMESFVGLLILAGVFKAHYRSTEDLWSMRDGQPVFRATMSQKRFKEIKRFLRFDDVARRNRDDPLAPCRSLFENFNTKIREYVTAPAYLTVDEQLLEFHGRVRFRQYIATKPGKFGIKILWLASSGGEYVFSGIVYIGANSLKAEVVQTCSSQAEAIVMQLAQPFLNNGRNITVDNWFTSEELADHLLQNNTTLVGTLRQNRRCIPPIAKVTTGRSRGDHRYYASGQKLLCSFWDKGNKPILLLDTCTQLATAASAGDDSRKPPTVEFYNQTKSGVDLVDKKVRGFSTKRKCNRWPVSVMSNLLDISGINAQFIHQRTSGVTMDRVDFLKSVGYNLIDQQIRRRITNAKSLQKHVRTAIELLGYTIIDNVDFNRELLKKQRRCQICQATADRKSKSVCCSCGKVICMEHTYKLCHYCVGLRVE